MAASQVAQSDVTNGGESLFNNIAFWLSSTVPQRSWFKERIQAKGGKVVNLEKDADYRLVDHKKKDLPHGTYSYQFVERSIQRGKLEDAEKYRAGPSNPAVRPVGSTTTRPKGRRTPFSAKDDQILYDWVKAAENEGASIGGNLIYQQLEVKYPHHTYQSWRDRYRTKLRYLPRPVTKDDIRTSRPDETRERPEPHHHPSHQTERTSTPSIRDKFTEAEKKKLLDLAGDILQVESSSEDDAWAKFAESNPEHTASEWKTYFHNVVRPEHIGMQRRRKSPVSTNNNSPSKRRSTALPPSTNIVSNGAQQGQSQSHRPGQRSLTTEDNVEVVVLEQKEQGKQAEKSSEAVDASLKRKRRHTGDDGSGVLTEHTGSPINKRRATDYVRTEASSASKSGQTASGTSDHPSGHDQGAPKMRPSDRPSKSSSLAKHANGTPKETANDTDSEEDQFETAPQFQSPQHHNDVQTRHEDDEDITNLLDTTLPGVPGHDDDGAERDENDTEVVQQVDDWVKARAPSGKAADMMPVIEALRCTSMDTILADNVLPYLRAGTGIPKNMRGVWTAEDDERLEGESARDVEAVYKKHGEELANARSEYLAQRRDAAP